MSTVLNQNSLDSATVYNNKSIEYNKLNHITNYSGQILIEKALIAMKKNKYSDALMVLDEAEEISKKFNFSTNLLSIAQARYSIYTQLKNYKEANSQLVKYMELKDKKSGQKNINFVFQTFADYEKEKQEKNIELKNATIREKEYQKQLLLFGFLIFAALFSILVYQYLQKNKLSKKLSSLNSDLNITVENRDKLLAIINHDFRSPLNNLVHGIKLQNDLIDENAVQENKQINKELLLKTQRLSGLVDDLLIWNKSHLKGFKQKMEVLDVESFELKIKSYASIYQSLEFAIQIEDKHDIITDVNLLFAAIRNLISNGMKAMNKGPQKMVVVISSTEKFFEVKVVDFGKGMNQAQIENLLNNKLISSNQSGLGFYLVKDIVSSLHGTISIQSEVGEYTQITILCNQGDALS